MTRAELLALVNTVEPGTRCRAEFRGRENSTYVVIGDLFENSHGVRMVGPSGVRTSAGKLVDGLISLAIVERLGEWT